MVDVKLKNKQGEEIRTITCTDIDNLYQVYKVYKNNYYISINGVDLERPHWRTEDNHYNYFAGYTKKFFERFFV